MTLFHRGVAILQGIILAASLAACAQTGPGSTSRDVIAPPMNMLVTADWLQENRGDPNLVIIDATVMIEQAADGSMQSVSGAENYRSGHIPGAVFADLTGDLSDANSPLQFALPSPEDFATAMERLGVGDNTRVVIYDANGSMWSARVWWMLRWIGFNRAALLDGGLASWTDAELPLSTAPGRNPLRSLTVDLQPELIAERDEVRGALGRDTVHLIDSLPEAHYRGDFSLYGRPGHIPGASNVPTSALVDESGRYRSVRELSALFGSDQKDRTITYCGGGIAASANAFILTRLGYKDVAVYAGSLQEWTADPENPLVTE